MKYGKYNLYGRDTFLLIDLYRDTTSIINNSDGIIWIDGNHYFFADTCQCFINRIIYNFPY